MNIDEKEVVILVNNWLGALDSSAAEKWSQFQGWVFEILSWTLTSWSSTLHGHACLPGLSVRAPWSPFLQEHRPMPVPYHWHDMVSGTLTASVTCLGSGRLKPLLRSVSWKREYGACTAQDVTHQNEFLWPPHIQYTSPLGAVVIFYFCLSLISFLNKILLSSHHNCPSGGLCQVPSCWHIMMSPCPHWTFLYSTLSWKWRLSATYMHLHGFSLSLWGGLLIYANCLAMKLLRRLYGYLSITGKLFSLIVF